MKLKNVQAYPIKDVPDHLTYECQELGKKIIAKLIPDLSSHDPNIVLGAIGFFYAAMIKELISDDPEQLKKAVQLYALGLIRNVEAISGVKLYDP